MQLKADLHVHTQRSFDSATSLEEAVTAGKRAGLHFLAITDHDLPPPEEVFSQPERDGLLLVPGIEYSTEKGHLLGLFLEKPCPPAAHKGLSFAQAVEQIHQCGGLAILAHPFQSTRQNPKERALAIEKLEPFLDGLEVVNRRAPKKRGDANLLASQAAGHFPKSCVATAGSDAHSPEEIGTAFLTVECPEKSLSALRKVLEAGVPAQYHTMPCSHRLIAKSQKVKLKKEKAPWKAWIRFRAFEALCLFRDLKGTLKNWALFQKEKE